MNSDGTSASSEGTAAPPRLLVVAQDEAECPDLEQRLLPLRERWNVSVVSTGAQALGLLQTHTFAAVITCLELSDMHGRMFHAQAARERPGTARFVRSNGSAGLSIPGAPDANPHLISLDPEPDQWDARVRSVLLLDGWLAQKGVRSLMARLRKLPTLPTVYNQVVGALQSPDTPIEKVARLIAKDPMMTAKLLQVANSAYFGLEEPVASAVEAVIFLGTERVKGLVLLADVFSKFTISNEIGLRVDELWRHCLESATFAQTVARWETKDERQAELAFTAGMLHDIGKLLLAGNLTADYRIALEQSRRAQLPLEEVETRFFGASHAQVGAVMMGTWGLPFDLVRAIGFHHTPAASDDTRFSVLTAVHAGDVLAHRGATDPMQTGAHFNLPYLRRLGLEHHRNDWRQLCGFKPDPADASPNEDLELRQSSRAN